MSIGDLFREGLGAASAVLSESGIKHSEERDFISIDCESGQSEIIVTYEAPGYVDGLDYMVGFYRGGAIGDGPNDGADVNLDGLVEAVNRFRIGN